MERGKAHTAPAAALPWGRRPPAATAGQAARTALRGTGVALSVVLPAVVGTELARGTATAGVPDEPGGGDGCGDALAAPPDVGADGSVLRRGAGEIGKRPAAMGIRNALNYKMSRTTCATPTFTCGLRTRPGTWCEVSREQGTCSVRWAMPWYANLEIWLSPPQMGLAPLTAVARLFSA